MKKEILRMERVTVKEDGDTQLENFSLTVWEGEIVGLVPVDNHGLSPFLKLLRQNTPIHYGYIYYNGRLVNQWRGCAQKPNRITLIQNRSSLAEKLTVADNIFVLRPGFKKRLIKPRILREQLEPFLADIQMEISADAYVESLSVFERFVVELLKGVVAGHRLIILFDVSTFISDAELEKLRGILRYYAGKGISFLYVAPHFEEVRQICSRTALMMNGQITKIFHSFDTVTELFLLKCTEEFERMVKEQMARKPDSQTERRAALRLKGLKYREMGPLDFFVSPGECLVLQDLDNQVIPGLLSVLSGEKRPEKGTVEIGGSPLQYGRDRRLAVIQELPARTMLFSNMNYLDNLCFNLDHRLPGVWLGGGVKKSLRMELADRLGREVFDIPVDELTEGQKYDLIYTRILLQNPDVVFCVQPFKGAGVSQRIHIYRLLEELLEKGIAVVILAVNLADSMALADRLLRVRKGKEVRQYDREEFGRLPVNTPWLYLYQK